MAGEGTVIAIGDDGLQVKPKDKVLYAKYTGTEIQIDGAAYLILESNDLLARISDP